MQPDEAWSRFRDSGDPEALGALFDAVSPELFRIALALAPDPATAEDALQETWLVALRAVERHDGERRVVPWLVGILRREILAARRRAPRTTPAPAAHAACASCPDPLEQLARDELTERARRALEALPPPYREVALLRWRHGLEPAEIADVRGMPPGTVRSLLHRALARVRRNWPATLALLPGVRLPRGLRAVRAHILRAARAAAPTGGLVMAKFGKTAAALIVGALLLGAATTVRLAHERTSARVRSGATDTEAPSATAAPRVRASHAVDEAAADAAAESDDGAHVEPFAAGLVVDASGDPIVGCRVLARNTERFGEDVQDAPVDVGAAPAAVTDAAGRFTVPVQPDGAIALTFIAEGFGAAELRAFGPELRVELAPADEFAARVVDTSGAPIEGADVRVLGPWERGTDAQHAIWLRTTTGAEGRFRFGSLPAGARPGQISAAGYRHAAAERGYFVDFADEYVLERAGLVVDVTDATDGAPLADARALVFDDDGAQLGVASSPTGYVATPAGRLVWTSLAPGRAVAGELCVVAPGHMPRRVAFALPAEAEPPHVRVALDRGDAPPALVGRVVDGAGARVAVHVVPRSGGVALTYWDDLSLPVAAESLVADDGSFRTCALPPGTYRVSVTRDDEVALVRELELPQADVVFAFGAHATLVVRSVDAAGAPRPGAWVHAESPATGLTWMAESDAEGVARFAALPPGDVVLLPLRSTGRFVPTGTSADAVPPSEFPWTRTTLPAGVTSDVELALPAAQRVTVRVRGDDGLPVRDAGVQAKLVTGLGRWLRDERERVARLELRTDADGVAVLEFLPSRAHVHVFANGTTLRRSVTVGAAPQDLEFTVPGARGVLRGRVTARGDGAPVASRPVTVWWDGQRIATTATDDEGRFTAGNVPAGSVRVSVAGGTDANDAEGRRVDPKSPWGYAETTLEMPRGGDVSVEMHVVRVRGDDAELGATDVAVHVARDDGTAASGTWVRVAGRVGETWCELVTRETDDDGAVVCSVPAAEAYRVTAFSDTGRAESEHERARALDVRLQLPAR